MIKITPARLAARFKNNSVAESAQKAVSDTLGAAEKEVAALFHNQGGIADSSDVSAIYTRHGFRNDCGWQQSTPIFVEEATLYWEIPDGMQIEDAEHLLLAFGALSLRQEDLMDEDLLRRVPHPAALFLSEIDDLRELDDEDATWMDSCEKKILH